MNKENNLMDLEKEEEQKEEKNVITKTLKDGNYYVMKKTKKNEYKIMKKLETLEHFPKISNKKETKKNFFVEMPYYQFIEVDFTENMWFIKNYVKHLLLAIQQLNKKKYFHGDIKPNNYLYLNPQKYVLIDFNASGKINGKDLSQKIATYPYIPPEINKYCEINIKNDKKRDLWSVGIILLLFMVKNEDIFENILKEKLKEKLENIDQEEKSLFQYAILYGTSNSKIKMAQKIKFEGKLGYFNNYFIENNYKRDENEKENAIDLIKKLLEFDSEKRIDIKHAINHAFFKNMGELNNNIIEYYKQIITDKKIKKKYDMIREFKICVICNKYNTNEVLKECRTCGNFYHQQCFKKKTCTCQFEIPDYEFMKIINTYLFINQYININFYKRTNEQIDFKLPSLDGEKYEISNFLNGKTFSNELIYECDQSLNYNLMEYGIFELNDKNVKIYNQLKDHTNDGEYNYIQICRTQNQGCVVKAIMDIQKYTLICEYIGDVFTYKNFCKQEKLENKNVDSNIDLIITPRAETSLIICPYNHSNIARFISGINNSDPNYKKLVNVFSSRVSINSSVHILLIASRNIKKNEILYYDYNGEANNYNTKNFVHQKFLNE